MEDKMTFKCRHCGNDNLKHMKFFSLEYQSAQYKNRMIPLPQWDRETMPKVPVGIHIKCAKCDKDTLFIPQPFGYTMWGDDITEDKLTKIEFTVPEYSAISYVINSDGYLDKIVKTSDNKIISYITKEELGENPQYSVINEEQYNVLLTRGLQEVKKIEEVKDEIKLENNDKKSFKKESGK